MEHDIIDAHVHLCRDVRTERLVYPRPGAPDRWYWGHPDGVDRYIEPYGLRNLVFLNVMDTAAMTARRLRTGTAPREELDAEMRAKVHDFNAWACALSTADPRLAPCVYVDPVLFGVEGACAEVAYGAAAGAHGVKMHPDISGFTPDDRALWPVFDAIAGAGLPVVFDTGAGNPRRGSVHHGEPRLFDAMLGAFPALTVVMAHFASAFWEQRVELARRHANVVFDTAGGFAGSEFAARGGDRALPEERAAAVIRDLGPDRFLFGSDGPAHEPGPQLRQLARLDLDPHARDLVFAANARRVYGIA